MAMLIKFGNYNKYYKYIIFSCIFNYLCYYVSFGDLSKFLFSLGIFDNKNIEVIDDLYSHPFLLDIFNYIFIIIISIILHKINEKKALAHKQNNAKKIEENDYRISLIHYGIKNINRSISCLNLYFILCYWIIIDHITSIIQSLMIFDYWMFELLFISLISSKILKISLYNHQKLGIIINSLSCLIMRMIILIAYIFYYDDKFNDILFFIKHKWSIPLSIIIYLFLVSSTSYIYTKLKFYMDLKFISLTKLLIIYGSLGFAFTSIACVIETNFKCVGSEKQFFCQIRELNVDGKYDYYIENSRIFFKTFSNLEKKDFIIEVFICFFEIIIYYCSLYFDMLVINYLTPMHFMFSSLIYVFIYELKNLINNIIDKKRVFLQTLNISSYIFSLIGFMIYLEIIELNFCKLNHNLRKYIKERSAKDMNVNIIRDSINSDDDDDNSEINIELPLNK